MRRRGEEARRKRLSVALRPELHAVRPLRRHGVEASSASAEARAVAAPAADLPPFAVEPPAAPALALGEEAALVPQRTPLEASGGAGGGGGEAEGRGSGE